MRLRGMLTRTTLRGKDVGRRWYCCTGWLARDESCSRCGTVGPGDTEADEMTEEHEHGRDPFNGRDPFADLRGVTWEEL